MNIYSQGTQQERSKKTLLKLGAKRGDKSAQCRIILQMVALIYGETDSGSIDG